VATYTYTDAEGKPVARKLRFEPGAKGKPKDFSWDRWEGGKWHSGLGSEKVPLYRLAKVINEPFAVLTEGEKDADAGASIGLPTATSGGTGSWREDHAECLRGKSAVIIADADEPGRVEAQKRASSLYGKAASVKVCEIPGCKDLAEAIEKGMTGNDLLTLFDKTPEWKPASGAALIRRFEEIFNRYIIAAKGVSLVCGLYALMTHCFDVFGWIAYLAFTSPAESCGKSHAADIVGWASARPEILVSITAPALYRLITEAKPTIVVDEAEVLTGEGETAVALRAVLHAGCAPDDLIIRCAPNTHELQRFSPWCPKVFCAIGSLPAVLSSRCIQVEMQRKGAGERTEKFIRRRVKAELSKLGAQMAVCVAAHKEQIREVYESLPDDSFEDRIRENFAPLEAILSIADPSRFLELTTARNKLAGTGDSCSDGVQLLKDIKRVFDDRKVTEIASAELSSALVEIEGSLWSECSRGKPLSTSKLARLLRPFRVAPDRIGGKDSQARGYTLHQFEDSFRCYLPSKSVNPSTERTNTSGNEDLKPSTESAVDTSENAVLPAKNAGGGRVDTFKPGIGGIEHEPRIRFADDVVEI
jgi:putative DNA primase/helicase